MSGFLLQGGHGAGKSTLLHKLLAQCDVPIGGYCTQRVMDGAKTRGFLALPLRPGDQTVPHTVYSPLLERRLFLETGPDGSKLYPRRFLGSVVPCLQDLLEHPPTLLVLDELGGFELLSERFWQPLCRLLAHLPVVGTFKSDANTSTMCGQTSVNIQRLQARRSQLSTLFVQQNITVNTLQTENYQTIEAQLAAFLESEVTYYAELERKRNCMVQGRSGQQQLL